MASSKSKKSKKPSIPEMAPPDMVYKPMTADEMADMWSKFMVLQQEWAPALRQNQKEAQELLYRSMSDLQREQAPQFAAKAWELMNTYMPSYTMSYEQLGADLRNQLSAGVPQQFLQAYQGLGRRVNQGLRQGYQLGDELSREVEQGIRGAQTARGNYLGRRSPPRKPWAGGRPPSTCTINVSPSRRGSSRGAPRPTSGRRSPGRCRTTSRGSTRPTSWAG